MIRIPSIDFKMRCPENCSCILCLELNGCETRFTFNHKSISDNFILSKPETEKKETVKETKTYTFFGMENSVLPFVKCNENNIVDFDSFKTSAVEKLSENSRHNVSLHKSIIYVDDAMSKTNENGEIGGGCNVILNEILDESTSLDTVQDSNVINVIFRNTYSFATQVINDVQFPECFSDVNSDDFPLGIEANIYNKILAERYCWLFNFYYITLLHSKVCTSYTYNKLCWIDDIYKKKFKRF